MADESGWTRETRTLIYPAGELKPEDLLSFIHFNRFTAEWKRLGLTDQDLRVLEVMIMASPTMAPVMKGTGGLRKLRFAPPRSNKGKSGGYRIGYTYIESLSIVGLIVVFAKNTKANLSQAEARIVRKLLVAFEKEAEEGFRAKKRK